MMGKDSIFGLHIKKGQSNDESSLGLNMSRCQLIVLTVYIQKKFTEIILMHDLKFS